MASARGPLSGCNALQPWRLPSCWHALPLAASSGNSTCAVAAALFYAQEVPTAFDKDWEVDTVCASCWQLLRWLLQG